VVLVGIAVTTKVPSKPVVLTSAIVASSPMVKPTGFAVVVVTVTVVPLSEIDEMALGVPGQVAGRPLEHEVPAAHTGIELVAVKASVAGLYNSAVYNPTCPVGAPEPAAGVVVLTNELPVEPPTIST